MSKLPSGCSGQAAMFQVKLKNPVGNPSHGKDPPNRVDAGENSTSTVIGDIGRPWLRSWICRCQYGVLDLLV